VSWGDCKCHTPCRQALPLLHSPRAAQKASGEHLVCADFYRRLSACRQALLSSPHAGGWEQFPPGTARSGKSSTREKFQSVESLPFSQSMQESKPYFKGIGKEKLFLSLPEALCFQVTLHN